MNQTVWRLLRRNISLWQIDGYALACLIGLTIVGCALKFHTDLRPTLTDSDSFLNRDYIILSKKVNGIAGIASSDGSTYFTPAEIDSLRAQPWVVCADPFATADFNVAAAVDIAGQTLSTALFLEALPTRYFDVMPPEWDYDTASQAEVPIIISKDYLALYNFGFAAGRGLPQISEELVSMIPLRLYLSGRGHYEWVNARIVGYSSRLNTIAVPEKWLEYANSRYGSPTPRMPSRIIVQLSQPGSPQIERYLTNHSLEASGLKPERARAAYLLQTLATSVSVVGIIIAALALFILTLSTSLLLQKNRRHIRTLKLLGYSTGQISAYYCVLVGAINALILTASAMLTAWLSHLWDQPLMAVGITPQSPIVAIAVIAAITIALTAVNVITIRRHVSKA